MITEFNETDYGNTTHVPPLAGQLGEVHLGSEDVADVDEDVHSRPEDLDIDPSLAAGVEPDVFDWGWDTPIGGPYPYKPREVLPERTELMATPVAGPALERHLTVHGRQNIGLGVEVKTLLQVRDDDGREFTLLERSTKEDPVERRRANDHYIDIWRASREAGLPVLPEVYESDDDTLLVTDVKADGSEVYGKGMADALAGYASSERRHRAHEDIDPLFMEATAPGNINAIKEQVQRYSRLATQAGIELPDDDPFELIVHPDGSWELVMLDLDRGMLPNPESDILTERMARKNAEAVDYCMYQLVKIRGILAKRAN